jgi:hypothetical protein
MLKRKFLATLTEKIKKTLLQNQILLLQILIPASTPLMIFLNMPVGIGLKTIPFRASNRAGASAIWWWKKIQNV